MYEENLSCLDEADVREIVREAGCAIDVGNIYSEALMSHDITIAILAQEELAKRGGYEIMANRFCEVFREGGIERDPRFSNVIAENFKSMAVPKPTSADPAELRRYGEFIRLKYEVNEIYRKSGSNFVW